MTAKPVVSIIVVNHNTRDLLRRCLEAVLLHSGGVPVEVFVVDNASSDGSAEMVRKEFPGVSLIENRENAGFARANNQALRLMRGDFALLLNSDAILKPGALPALLSFAAKKPEAAAAGPRLVREDGSLQPSAYDSPSPLRELLRALRAYKLLPARLNSRLFLSSFFDHRESRRAGRLTGACLLLRKKALDELGLLCEEFFFYGEVHDWCLRAIAGGWEVWFCADAEVVHLGGQSSARKWPEEERLAVSMREQERLLARNLPVTSKWAVMLLRLIGGAAALLRLNLPFTAERDPAYAARLRIETFWIAGRFRDTASWIFRRSLPSRLFLASGLHRALFIGRLSALTGISRRELLGSVIESGTVAEEIEAAWKALPEKPSRTGRLDFASAEMLYALVRNLKPGKVMETGVANGISSFYILAAMEKNGRGRLISIDCVPEGAPDFLPPGKGPGWLIPAGLRGRWELVAGSSAEHLPRLLEREAPVDIFLHDSEHSYANMMFEYSSAWPRLRGGGLLLTDDAGLTFAFRDFAARTGAPRLVLADKLGVMKKGGRSGDR